MHDRSVALAIAELDQQQFRMTQRLLADHKISMRDGQLHIARVDQEEEDGSVIVYFGVENRSYFLAVRIDPLPQPKIRSVSVEAGTEAYLVSYSTTHPLRTLLAATQLTPTEQWDMDAGGGSSGVHVKVPLPLADSADDNVNHLLDVLEQDTPGVQRLTAMTNAVIQVHWYGFTTALSVLKLKTTTLHRIAALGLGIDLDINTSN